MSEYISAQDQRLVIEKLYRSTDSITSTEKFNSEYSDKIGKLGDHSIPITEFGRKMKKTSFSSYDIERFIKDITSKTIDIDTAKTESSNAAKLFFKVRAGTLDLLELELRYKGDFKSQPQFQAFLSPQFKSLLKGDFGNARNIIFG